MIRKSRKYKIFVIFLFVLLCIYTFIILIVQPPRKQWFFCNDQFANGIEQNNIYLKGVNAGLAQSCPIQAATILQAEACYKDVAEMNFLSHWLLSGRLVKELERIKALHQTECGSLQK